MKLKAFLSILLVIVFSLTMAACSGGKKDQKPFPPAAEYENDDEDEIVDDDEYEDEDDGEDATEPSTTEPTTEQSSGEEAEDQTSSEPAESTEASTDGTDPDESASEQTSSEEASENEGGEAEAAPSNAAEGIVSTAKSLIGASFEYGKDGPDTFDNSGFVYYCCKQNGVKIARRTSEMTGSGRSVGRDELKPGDVVLFSNEIAKSADFTGIYIGNGQFISCNTETSPVGIRSLTSGYWADRFIEGRRVAE